MRQRSFLGPDPLATVTFAGMALVACAALLGSAGIDGSAVGIVDALVAAVPVGAVLAYLLWVNGEGNDDSLEQAAVSILVAQADDPTIRGDDDLSRAAADLLAAMDEKDREAARRRLRDALSR